MANNNQLHTQLTISAGVEGINDVRRLADTIEQAGGNVDDLRQSATALESAWGGLSTTEQTQQLNQLASQAERLRQITSARMTLGLTGDDAVRQQIADVTQAYQTLQASGTLSQQELARATQLHTQQVAQLEAQLGQTRPTMQDIASEMGNIVANAGGLAYVVREAMKFETAMADVKKVVDGTPEQIEALSTDIQRMAVEMGMSSEAMAQMTAQGGQLGVALEDLPQFTKMAGQMAVAFNMTAEEAGDAAAKMANVWGIPIEKVGELGDAINTLGNTTAAKEREIVDVMNRIGGTAKSFGLAKEEAAALSAAFISLGKTPETAGTAINALLTKLSTASVQSDDFKNALAHIGISADQLAKDINDNPQKALDNFLQTLGTLSKEQQSITTFKLFGQEYVDDISLLVGGLDTYKKALGEVADKSATAGAMQKEFEARLDTTGASLEQAKASVGVLAQTIGTHLLPIITSALDAFTDVTSAVTDFANSYPNLTQFITILASAQVGLTAMSSTMRLLGATGLSSFGQITTGATTATGAITGATTATATLSTALNGVAKSAVALTGAFMAGNAIGDWAYNSSSAVRSVGDELGRLLAYTDAIFTDRTFADVNAHFETSAQSAQRLADNAQKAVQELQKIGDSNADFATKISQTETAIGAITARIDELTRYGQTSTTEYAKLSGELNNAKVKLDELKQAQADYQVTTKNATSSHIELANNIKITTAELESMELALARMEASGQTGSNAHKTLSDEIGNTKDKLELLNIEANKQGIGELLKTDLDKASESFKTLGLDAQEFATGISSGATGALNAFMQVARLAGDDVDKLARAYNAVKDKIGDNVQAQELLNFKLAQATNGNKELASAVLATANAQRHAKNATTEQQKALDALGVSMSAVNAGMSTSGQKMAQNLSVGLSAIKDTAKGADELKVALNQALDTALASAKTQADFKAIQTEISSVGLTAQVSAQHMAKIQAGMSQSTAHATASTKDNTTATVANTKAHTDNAKVKQSQSQANKELVQSTNEVSSSLATANKNASVSHVGLSGLGIETEKLTKIFDNFYATLSNVARGGTSGYLQAFGEMMGRQAQARQEMMALKDEISKMGESLDSASISTDKLTDAQKLFKKASDFSIAGVKAMDNATLKNLQNQIDKASEKIKALSDTARQTVADLESELASIHGNEQEVLRIKHAQKLADLEAKIAQARTQGNADAIASYEKALNLQRQINEAEHKNLKDKQNQTTTLNLNVGKGGATSGNLGAGDVVKAWEQSLYDAKQEAKQELIKEMIDASKTRAR